MTGLYMNKALYRIENYIKRFPNTEIWVLANKKESAKIYWKHINQIIDTRNIRPQLISSRSYSIDGLNPKNTLIIVCGKWWENPNARHVMDLYFNMVDKIFAIDELPR